MYVSSKNGDVYYIQFYFLASSPEVSYTWSGRLPPRHYKNPTYSTKVFLGGVPWDITESKKILKTPKMVLCHKYIYSKQSQLMEKTAFITRAFIAAAYFCSYPHSVFQAIW